MLVPEVDVVVKVTAVDEVRRAFRNIRLMWRQVKVVAAAVVVIDDIVTEAQFRETCRADESVQPDGEVAQFRKVTVAVAVAVVSIAVTVLREEVETGVVIFHHGRGIRVRGVVEGAGEIEVGDAVSEAAAVAGGLFRDDVDDTTHG